VITKAPSHDLLARMADDVRQLTNPIHTAVRGRVVTHDPLLDQLRAAAVPGGGIQGEHRRTVPTSRPPARLDVVDILAGIYVEISQWHAILRNPSPLREEDWQKAVLRQFVGHAPTIAPSLADELSHAVRGWWHDAAVGSGWRPADLLKLR
jgi:hypothetical protein